MYKCQNCGFVFKTPKLTCLLTLKKTPEPRILFETILVCPKCSSDAIQNIKGEN